MIRINKGREPSKLKDVRSAQLKILRALGRDPESKEIRGYDCVAEALWKAQHSKCCYCERRISLSFNDVEHHRPKTAANRQPGCLLTHGYWWLAFDWSNLLLSCATCNRSEKRCDFPLAVGSSSLSAEDPAPGNEVSLLIDPGDGSNPLDHLRYDRRSISGVQHWWATALSPKGSFSIKTYGLNRQEYRELREQRYTSELSRYVAALRKALETGAAHDVAREFERALFLFLPNCDLVALSYDVLTSEIDEKKLASFGFSWPHRSELPLTEAQASVIALLRV